MNGQNSVLDIVCDFSCFFHSLRFCQVYLLDFLRLCFSTFDFSWNIGAHVLLFKYIYHWTTFQNSSVSGALSDRRCLSLRHLTT
jgi:hypothetical protein